MSLRVVPVSQALEKKLLMLGFEVLDLLAISLTLAILNFLFGQTSLRLMLVWLPTILLAALLRFGKKGKPDNYLIHLMRYQITPGTYTAFHEPTNTDRPPRLKKK